MLSQSQGGALWRGPIAPFWHLRVKFGNVQPVLEPVEHLRVKAFFKLGVLEEKNKYFRKHKNL